MTGICRPPAKRQGFSLPAVLAVTGVVALVFLVAMTALTSLTSEAASARARLRFLQSAMTAEATLSYMLATEPLSLNRITIGAPRDFDTLEDARAFVPTGQAEGHVLIDGHPYLMSAEAPVVVRLQDAAGLINVSRLEGEGWRRVMRELGATASGADLVHPRFVDYTDTDSLRQPNGAESESYPPGGPPNRPLRRPSEVLSVLGMRETVDPARWRAMRDEITSIPVGVDLNINTATQKTLETTYGLSSSAAAAVIRSRSGAPFSSIQDFAAISGLQGLSPDDTALFFPNGEFRLLIHDSRSAWVYRARIILTPYDLEQPFWIDQTELSEAPRRRMAEISDVNGIPYAPY